MKINNILNRPFFATINIGREKLRSGPDPDFFADRIRSDPNFSGKSDPVLIGSDTDPCISQGMDPDPFIPQPGSATPSKNKCIRVHQLHNERLASVYINNFICICIFCSQTGNSCSSDKNTIRVSFYTEDAKNVWFI